ncbi:MAG: O-antigen ligase family protein, partial [Parcubacteria group bacterium]|nr:O-antigen ligase family protein [Parcubacteria group bacterium]
LAVVVGGFMFARGSSFVKDSPVLSRLASISISEGDPRFAVWNMGYQAFKERPILGWGQENFIFAFNKYYDPKIYDQEPWFDRVHNIFFDWLVAGGILGLVSYLGLYFFSLYYLWFGGKSVFSTAEKSIFTGVFAGYFFHNLFVFDNIASYVLFFSVLAYIHHRVVSGKEAPSYSEYSRSSINRLVVPAVSVLLIASVYLLNVPGVLQARALLKALSPNQEGVSKNLELFRDALEYDTFGNQEIREQLMRGSISFVSRQDVELNDKQELFSLTVGEYKKQIEQSPNDARHHLFLGTVYRAYGQNDLALESVSRALELSPQKQVILFEIGLNQLNKNNTSAALSTFKKAFELAPEYTSARIFYAVSAIYAGDRALADSLLNDGFGTLIVSDDLLVQAYFDVGLLDRVIAIWESRVNSQPNNAQFHISLGAAYLQAGRRSEAVAEIRKAIEFNPAFKEQGEFFIKEIQAGRNP